MKISKILSLFLLSIHIQSGLTAAGLTVIAYRGAIASVVVSPNSVFSAVDLGTGTDLGPIPVPVGELNLIVFNNTADIPHNLEIYSTHFDLLTSQFIVRNEFATIKLEISKNFDSSGNITGFNLINPSSNPFPLLSSITDIQKTYVLKFAIASSIDDWYIDGDYKTSIVIRFITD